jgi:hypothetical protein
MKPKNEVRVFSVGHRIHEHYLGLLDGAVHVMHTCGGNIHTHIMLAKWGSMNPHFIATNSVVIYFRYAF